MTTTPRPRAGASTETTTVNKQKAVQQYQDVAGAGRLVPPSYEQVMIARVGIDQLHRKPEPQADGRDPRAELAQIRLPDQAVRSTGPNLARAQIRRERHQQRQQQQASRRAHRKPFTVGDLLGNIGVGAFVLLALVVVAIWLGVPSWPVWGAR